MLGKQKGIRESETKQTGSIAGLIKAATPAVSKQLKFNDLCQESNNRKF